MIVISFWKIFCIFLLVVFEVMGNDNNNFGVFSFSRILYEYGLNDINFFYFIWREGNFKFKLVNIFKYM